MKYAQLPTVLLLLAASGVSLTADGDWIPIGESGLGPWQIYVGAESLKTDSNGHVRVAVLDDHRVAMQGVDRVNSSGEMYYDTRFKHRSSITSYVLDCENRREVLLRVRYYAGDLGTGTLVLEEKESEPMWTDFLFTIEGRLTTYACDKVG